MSQKGRFDPFAEWSVNDRYCVSRLPTASSLNSNPEGSPGKHAIGFDL
jgi:hypothetical protein